MTPRRQRIHLFRSCEDGPPHINRESVLVEVPGKWAYSVVSLIHVSQEYRQAGLIVTNIGPGSQGARAGMAQGDVLLRYEGQDKETPLFVITDTGRSTKVRRLVASTK